MERDNIILQFEIASAQISLIKPTEIAVLDAGLDSASGWMTMISQEINLFFYHREGLYLALYRESCLQ